MYVARRGHWDKLAAELTPHSTGTTDAIFLEKPAYFDLVINLATSTPSRTSRPTLYVSKTADNGPDKPLSYRLSAVRFAWSDVRLVCPFLPASRLPVDLTDHRTVERARSAARTRLPRAGARTRPSLLCPLLPGPQVERRCSTVVVRRLMARLRGRVSGMRVVMDGCGLVEE